MRKFEVNRIIALIVAGLASAVLMTGCVDRQAQKDAALTQKLDTDPIHAVVVTPVETKTMSKTLNITGEITANDDSSVGVKLAGRLAAVSVQDGDHVYAGQVIAMQDTSSLTDQLDQAIAQQQAAQASLVGSRSQLAVAIKNAQINPIKAAEAVVSARAALRAAQANYLKSKEGLRPQEILQAVANERSAKEALAVQKSQLDRIQKLVDQGGLAANQLDAQKQAYAAALGAYQNAEQALSLAKEGNRPEDIQAAKEAVNEAQQVLATAVSNQGLNSTYFDQVNVARAQLDSARAQLDAASAAVQMARQAVSDSTIRAPFSGYVSGKPTQVGTMLSAGGVVARIVGTHGLYFSGQVTSDDISGLQIGMPVVVSIPSIIGAQVSGHITAITPVAASIGRLFSTRIDIDQASANVRPGMFATGRITTRSVLNAMVIPSVALVQESDGQYVFIADGTHAKLLKVKTGIISGSEVQVIGLSASDQVITQGKTGLQDGSLIKAAASGSGVQVTGA